MSEYIVIPKPTHEYAKAWKQPDSNNILIDAKYALMSKDSFDQLLDYSQSRPSAVYGGKMWKCSDDQITWYLKWWVDSKDLQTCSNHVREIVIMD
jgi:hypothetical protein